MPVDAQAWRRGRKRYWIEPTFRDWKSYGFDLEKRQLEPPSAGAAAGPAQVPLTHHPLLHKERKAWCAQTAG